MSTPAWRRAPAALFLLGLAACGADPEPGTPAPYRLEHAGLHVDLSEQGASVAPAGGAGWVFQAAPRRFGCDGALAEVGAARPAEAGDRVEYRRPGIVEWYADTTAGIEQGFTLPAPPCGNGRGVVVELGSGLRAAASAGGRDARLRDASGRDALRYTNLRAADATGRALPVVLEAREQGLAIRVDDTGAVYPVEIDPLIWTPTATLTPSDAAQSDNFGKSIGLSGDTVVVGAPGADDFVGAAYVFVRSGTAWTQQAKLVASGGVSGAAVALDGDTALVAAASHDGPTGEVNVFDRSGTTWSLTAQLPSPAGAVGFGFSLALSADTAIVGSNAGAYVYARAGSTWTLQATLADPAPEDQFGFAVALSGDTAVVGAPGALTTTGNAYVFLRTGTTWTQQASLTVSQKPGDDFGFALALAGDTSIVGSPNHVHVKGSVGSAFVFSRTGTTWAQKQLLDGDQGDGRFGAGLAFDGTTLVVMNASVANSTNSAHAFTLDAGTFAAEQIILTHAAPSAALDTVGVAVEATTVVTGAPDIGQAFVVSLLSSDGDACTSGAGCASGFCVDGVCCTTASCPAEGACNAAEHCQPGTGLCSNTPIHDGMACDAHDACTHDTVCQQGACVGPSETCAPANECQEFGTCDPATGACSTPPKPDGTTCAGGTCLNGECDTGSAPAPPSGHGCGCEAAGAQGGEAAGVGMGLLLMMRRRRRRERRWS